MNNTAYDKIKAIYDRTRLDYFVMGISHLFDIGWRAAHIMTDEDIEALKGNDFMTDDFCKYLCRLAREIAQTVTPIELTMFCMVEKLFDTKGFKPRKKQG